MSNTHQSQFVVAIGVIASVVGIFVFITGWPDAKTTVARLLGTSPTNSSPETDPVTGWATANVVFIEDFERDPALISSDGKIVPDELNRGNRVMKFTGDGAHAFEVPMKLPVRDGRIGIRLRAYCPYDRDSGQDRFYLRIRLYDEKGNSKVAFLSSPFSSSWQTIHTSMSNMDGKFIQRLMIETVHDYKNVYFDRIEILKL